MSLKSILQQLCTLCIPVFLLAAAAPADDLGFRNIARGRSYPEFCGDRVDGGRFCAGELIKNVAVIMFFKPGQDISARQLAILEDLHRGYGQKKVKIIAIAAAGDDGTPLAAAMRKAGVTFPVVRDDKRELAGLFGAYAFPSTGVFASDGSLDYFTASNWVNYHTAIDSRIRHLLGELPARQAGGTTSAQPSAAEQAGNRAETNYNLARILFDTGQPDKAEQVLIRSLGDYEGHAPSHLLLGKIARQRP